MTDRTGAPQATSVKSSGSGAFEDFSALVAKASERHRAGDSEQALALAKQAEAQVGTLDPPQSSEAARAFNDLGMVFFESGYTRSAAPAYERARVIVERLEPPDEELLASLYNNLGQAHYRLGRLAEAQSELEAAVAIDRRIVPSKLVLGFALDNLASVLTQRGDLDAAESMHLEALEIFQRAGGPFSTHVATALGNLSTLYRRRHDASRAEAFRLRALDTHERTGGLTAAETLLDLAALADLYRDRGDDARADVLMNLLLSIGSDTPSRAHRNLAEMLSRLATSAFGDFRLDLAERLGARAVDLLDAIEGPNAPDTLKALHLRANVQRATGNFEAAEQAYRRARSGYEMLQMPDELIAVTVDLGKFYRDTGSYAVAAELFRAAATYLHTRPKRDHQGLASALGNLGLVYYEAEHYIAADSVFVEALAELADDPNKYGERPWLLHNQAMLKYHLGQYDLARKLYEEAKRLWTESEGEHHPFVATAAANLALVHWVVGDVRAAFALFAEAERLRDHEMVRILAVGSERQRAAYARDMQSDLHKVVTFCLGLQSHPETARFAAQMLLRRKGRVLDAMAHTFKQLHESGRAQDQGAVNRLQTVWQEITALIGPVLARRPPEDRQRLAELRAEENRLEAALSYRGALHDPRLEEVTFEQIQESLPADAALLEMLRFSPFDPVRTGKKGPWGEERYAALVVAPVGGPQWFDLGPAATIDRLMDQWRKLLCDRSSEDGNRNEIATRLYQLLIAPFSDLIVRARHLFVATDGKLVLIPFGELRDTDGCTLASRFVLSYLSSGRDLQRVDATETESGDILVIVAPDYEATVVETTGTTTAESSRFTAYGRLPPLPQTMAEGEEISRLLPGARLLSGPEATVDALRSAKRPVILHVATHGIFAPLDYQETQPRFEVMAAGEQQFVVQGMVTRPAVNPMFSSGLALSGANQLGAGILTAQEIAGLDWRGTQLVVLSACETGLGAVKRGEEFAGLRRALAIAGAMTQVTSLWNVSDVATRVLMGHYYQLLLEGHGRAEALQLAQSRVANDQVHPQWKHPAYWAAFVSAGAWGPLRDQLKTRAGATSGA